MASISNNATVSASNGLGPTTYIVTADDVSVNSVANIVTEIQNEGGTIAGIEDDISSDGCYIIVQGGPTPAVANATVQATIVNS